MDQKKVQSYLQRNIRLMVILMVCWAVFSLGAAAIAPALNSIVFGGFPLGYYMGAQGALLIFLAIIFYNAVAMDKLDQEFVGQSRSVAGSEPQSHKA